MKINKTTIFISMILIAFMIFFFLKVNGFFDYTHKYHIKDITATIDNENIMSVLDDDMATVWNEKTFLGETFAGPKDNIFICFDRPVSINGIKMDGTLPEGLLFLTDDGKKISVKKTDAAGEFLFDETVVTDDLVIEVPEGEEQSWHIAELEVYED